MRPRPRAASSAAVSRLVGSRRAPRRRAAPSLSAALPRPRPRVSRLGLERLRRGRRQFGGERQMEAEHTEQRDRGCGAVYAEQPLACAVQAQPDLADRGADDEHSGEHVQSDRPDPQRKRQPRRAELGLARPQQGEHHRQRGEADQGAGNDAQQRSRGCATSRRSAHSSGAARRRSRGFRRGPGTMYSTTPRSSAACSSLSSLAGVRPERLCERSHPGPVRRIGDLNP